MSAPQAATGSAASTTQPQAPTVKFTEPYDSDGNILPRQIVSYLPLNNTIGQPQPDFVGNLRILGLALRNNEQPVRLLNNYDTSSRWITPRAFNLARPQPYVHPAYQSRLLEIRAASGLAQERATLASIVHAPGNEQDAPFHTATRLLRYYVGLGSAVWAHFSPEARQDRLHGAMGIINGPGCPPDVAAEAGQWVQQLQAAASHALPRQPRDQEDPQQTNALGNLVQQSMTRLIDHVIAGTVEYEQNHLNGLMDDLRTIFLRRIGADSTIDLLGLTMIVWPNREFENASPAIAGFMNDQQNFLAVLAEEVANP